MRGRSVVCGRMQRCFMCGRVHYGEVEGLVSVERWSCSRGASCVVRYSTQTQH